LPQFITPVRPALDYLLQIAVTVTVAVNAGLITGALSRYTDEFTVATRYIIENYSFENYKLWKRIVVLSACGYLCVAMAFVEVNNWVIVSYITQYAVCFILVEMQR
jgi:hypothetical protein